MFCETCLNVIQRATKKSTPGLPVRCAIAVQNVAKALGVPQKASSVFLLQTQTAALKSQSQDHTGTDSWPEILLPTHCSEKVPRQALYLQNTRGHRRQQSKWQENSAASAAHNSASASLARNSRICQANERILYIAACDFHSKNLYRW